MTPAEQVSRLRQAGYRGMVSASFHASVLEDFARVPAVRDGSFKVVSALWWHEVAEPLDSVKMDRSLVWASKLGASVWMVASGDRKDPRSFSRALDRFDVVARHCQAAGVELVVYPHSGCIVQTLEESLPLLDSLRHRGRTNVKTSIHLSHELKAGNARRMPEVVAAGAGRIALASISGAEEGPFVVRTGGWESVIMPLDRGNFDLGPFLSELSKVGYEGPMILHTFGLPNPSKPGYDQHLERSLGKWKEWSAKNTQN